jgi:predicted transposase/invertase (TIGR01784 family)
MSKYINPFTDFGFKRIFGEEFNKDLLIDFLNELLREEEGTITNITYMTPEQLGITASERRAVFDIYCENERGEKFIVEMQKAKQKYFKDRSVYYSSFPIQQQAIRGDEWNFELKAIYTIGILDFVFEEDQSEADKLLYKVKLTDVETQRVFYDKLTYIYLEMPKFRKTESELETRFDQWLYVLKNLPHLEQYPARLRDRVFKKLFEVAEIAAFTPIERVAYEESVKIYRDLKNVMDTAVEESFSKGRLEGLAEGEARLEVEKQKAEAERQRAEAEKQKAEADKREIAQKMAAMGMDKHAIRELTGLESW